MRRLLYLTAILTITAAPGSAEGGAPPGSATSVADFELMQYLATGRLSPERVMDLDNNGEILLACRDGCSREDLDQAGLAATESQLRLLQIMNLMREETGGQLSTSFPILDRDECDRLRARAEGLAREAISELRPQFEELAATLSDNGMGSQAYLVYFSYVLDGRTWGFLEEYGRVPQRHLSAARPFWAGEIWALESPREDWAGTAAIADRGLTLKVLLGRSTERTAAPLLRSRGVLKKALAEYLVSGRVEDGEARQLLGRYGIADPDGTLVVPVIDEIGGDAVFRAAEKLTADLVDWLLAELDFSELRAEFGLRDDPQVLVVVYHEMMWSLMSVLEEEGLAVRPASLDADGPVADGEIGRTVLLVDGAHRGQLDNEEEELLGSKRDEEGS